MRVKWFNASCTARSLAEWEPKFVIILKHIVYVISDLSNNTSKEMGTPFYRYGQPATWLAPNERAARWQNQVSLTPELRGSMLLWLSESLWPPYEPPSWLKCWSNSILSQFPLGPRTQLWGQNSTKAHRLDKETPTWTCLQNVFHHRNWPLWQAYFSRKQGSLLSKVLALASHNQRRRAASFFYFFLLAHNLLVMWVWHKMTAVNTAGHLLAFQWWLY